MVATFEDKTETLLGMTENISLEYPDVKIANSASTVYDTM
jgi:hypothetical protein